MHLVEVIRLRLAAANRDEIIVRINELADRLELADVQIYRHATVDTDLSIHLDHRDAELDAAVDGPSLASLLKEFGLVSYSKWVEAPSFETSLRKRG